MTLQDAVKARIKEHGTLRATEKATGVDQGYLSYLAHGIKANPSPETLAMLGIKRTVDYSLVKP
jgi:transcriptional regulator with XRE-family HTH domain